MYLNAYVYNPQSSQAAIVVSEIRPGYEAKKLRCGQWILEEQNRYGQYISIYGDNTDNIYDAKLFASEKEAMNWLLGEYS